MVPDHQEATEVESTALLDNPLWTPPWLQRLWHAPPSPPPPLPPSKPREPRPSITYSTILQHDVVDQVVEVTLHVMPQHRRLIEGARDEDGERHRGESQVLEAYSQIGVGLQQQHHTERSMKQQVYIPHESHTQQ